MKQGTLQRLVLAVSLLAFANVCEARSPFVPYPEVPGVMFPTAAGILRQYAAPNPQAMRPQTNLYSYANANPISYIDPNGLSGVGVIGGATAEGGLFWGGGATGSVGHGFFWGGQSGANYGVFAGGGAFEGGPSGITRSCPATPSIGTNMVAGFYAGLSAGLFYTNATDVADLAGGSMTHSVNIGLGALQLSFQSSGAPGINLWTLTFGPGWGISISGYPTYTWIPWRAQ